MLWGPCIKLLVLIMDSLLQRRVWSRVALASSPNEPVPQANTSDVEFLRIPSDGTDDWEIDHNHLKYNHKVASGSFGDL